MYFFKFFYSSNIYLSESESLTFVKSSVTLLLCQLLLLWQIIIYVKVFMKTLTCVCMCVFFLILFCQPHSSKSGGWANTDVVKTKASALSRFFQWAFLSNKQFVLNICFLLGKYTQESSSQWDISIPDNISIPPQLSFTSLPFTLMINIENENNT